MLTAPLLCSGDTHLHSEIEVNMSVNNKQWYGLPLNLIWGYVAIAVFMTGDGFELAFLFGSFQPDCNPLTYLKGSLRAYKFRGHNYSNSQHYIYSRISRLQRRQRWTIWQYYTLGKLTHYRADAFTYPHNENYPDSMLCHHQYETDLRAYLEEYLATRALRREKFRQDVADALQELHRQYMAGVADMRKDVQFLLMAGCLPASAAAAV